MKLLVHNFLSSKFLRNVTTGYPLKIVASKVTVNEEVPLNKDFILRMIPKLEWSALKAAADSIPECQSDKLPTELPPAEQWEQDENFLKAVNHVLLGVEVEEGDMFCPETDRKFPITSGIPNMLANEDEVA